MSKQVRQQLITFAGFVRALVVSRDSAVLTPLLSFADGRRWQVEGVASGWEAMERVQLGLRSDLLLLDVPAGDSDSLQFLRWLRRLHPELPALVVCDRDDLSTRREALRLGARGFLLKPLKTQFLEFAIRQQLLNPGVSSDPDLPFGEIAYDPEHGFVAHSPVMRALRSQIELLAQTDDPVLILGEASTGKETIARRIHQLSPRSQFPFATIDCAALSSELLELELFGYAGEPSGRKHRQPGMLEGCHGGTLLLEQAVELPRHLQSKLLGVMQSNSFVRPETGAVVRTEVRILAASTIPYTSVMSDSRLLQDFRSRLGTYTVQVPPVRERREDLPLLLRQMTSKLTTQYAMPARSLPPAMVEACQAHTWPGNFRELETFVKRFLLAGVTERATGLDVAINAEKSEPGSVVAEPADSTAAVEKTPESLKSVVQLVKLEAEKSAIAAALQRTGWNRKAAARLLKVSYRTLLYKIDQYQMRASGPALVATAPNASNSSDGCGENPSGEKRRPEQVTLGG